MSIEREFCKVLESPQISGLHRQINDPIMTPIRAALAKSKYYLPIKYSSNRKGAKPYQLVKVSSCRVRGCKTLGPKLWRPVPSIQIYRKRIYKLDKSFMPHRCRWVDITSEYRTTTLDGRAKKGIQGSVNAVMRIDLSDDFSTGSTSIHTDDTYIPSDMELPAPSTWVGWSDTHNDYMENHMHWNDKAFPEPINEDDESLQTYISFCDVYETYANWGWKPSFNDHRVVMYQLCNYSPNNTSRSNIRPLLGTTEHQIKGDLHYHSTCPM